jgi:hypothetical protein
MAPLGVVLEMAMCRRGPGEVGESCLMRRPLAGNTSPWPRSNWRAHYTGFGRHHAHHTTHPHLTPVARTLQYWRRPAAAAASPRRRRRHRHPAARPLLEGSRPARAAPNVMGSRAHARPDSPCSSAPLHRCTAREGVLQRRPAARDGLPGRSRLPQRFSAQSCARNAGKRGWPAKIQNTAVSVRTTTHARPLGRREGGWRRLAPLACGGSL